MKKNKREKGQYGYRDCHRKLQIGEVAFGAAMIMAQLFARNLTDSQAAKNVLTLMAILSVLPTANVASPLIAAFRFRTPGAAFYQKVSPYETKVLILYDLLITSKEALMPMDAVAVHPTGIYAYCTASKLDTGRAEHFFADMFSGHGLSLEVRVIKEEAVFLKRLNSLKPEEAFASEEERDRAVSLLKSLSM